MGRPKVEREPVTLRSQQLKELPPSAGELAARVLKRGGHEQWERSMVVIIAVHERRRPGMSRTRARAARAEIRLESTHSVNWTD